MIMKKYKSSYEGYVRNMELYRKLICLILI